MPSSCATRPSLSNSTYNHRRHGVTNLVGVLIGPRASFDLLNLVRFALPPPKPRFGRPPAHLADIPAGPVTHVRLEQMHWPGMRPSQLGRLRAEDLRLDEPIPYVAVPRGESDRTAAVPLVPRAVLRPAPFLDARAFGPGQQRQPRARQRRQAGRTAGVHHYQIRHSFRRRLRRAGTDVADIQDLYGHTRPETTMIYAPPELAKHRAALERLRRTDAHSAHEPAARPVRAGTDGWQNTA